MNILDFKMDTQNLLAFQRVAELGSFSEAAGQLHLTQPAVSKRIAALESQLNCRLFDRIGRTIRLTEAGLTLLPQAKHILLEVEQTHRMIADLSGDIGGCLSLVTSHHIGLHRLPPVLRQFCEQYPGVKLELDFLDSEKTYEAVTQGRAELAVTTLAPEATLDPETTLAPKDNLSHHPLRRNSETVIVAQVLWTDPLSFVCSLDHPLASLGEASGNPIRLEDLSRFPVILPELNTYTTHIVKNLFDRLGLPLEPVLCTNYLETIKMMVSIGLGWGVLPASMVDKQVSVLQVGDTRVVRQLGCIYHRNRSLSNAARAFLTTINGE